MRWLALFTHVFGLANCIKAATSRGPSKTDTQTALTIDTEYCRKVHNVEQTSAMVE